MAYKKLDGTYSLTTTEKKRSNWRVRIYYLVKGAKRRAISNNLSFNITHEELLKAVFDNNYRCARSGAPLRLVCPVRHETNSPFSPSLDRVDSSLGYISGNVEIVAYMYNCCKNRFTDAEVRTFASHMHNKLEEP